MFLVATEPLKLMLENKEHWSHSLPSSLWDTSPDPKYPMEHTLRNTGVVQTLRQYSVIKWPEIFSGLNKPQSEKWPNWDQKPAFLALRPRRMSECSRWAGCLMRHYDGTSAGPCKARHFGFIWRVDVSILLYRSSGGCVYLWEPPRLSETTVSGEKRWRHVDGKKGMESSDVHLFFWASVKSLMKWLAEWMVFLKAHWKASKCLREQSAGKGGKWHLEEWTC